MEQTPYDRLEAFWQAKGLRNMSAFADAVRLKPGTLSAIKQRASKPTAAVLEVIQNAFPDLSTEYILWGRGPMLKDGRALAPLPVQQADYTSGPGTVNTVVETLLRDRLADKDALIEMLRAEVSELRGKPFDSSDAAGPAPLDPNDPRFAGGLAPLPMIRKRAGFTPSYVEAAELSE